MRSKAISPMIATILLIAFTVAVGGIISIWMTSYTRTTGAQVSAVTNDTLACTGSYPNVILVTSTAVIITNPGSESLTGVKCYATGGENITIGTIATGATSSATWTRGTNSSVICTGQCKTIGVSGQCMSGQSCWT